jgi:hypothetical protein
MPWWASVDLTPGLEHRVLDRGDGCGAGHVAQQADLAEEVARTLATQDGPVLGDLDQARSSLALPAAVRR